MSVKKKPKKGKKPLAIRIIKFILIALACAILVAAIIQRTIHFFRYHV
jgi:hypothetical protein